MSSGAGTLLGLDRRLVPLAGTLTLFVAMIIFGAVSYDAFLAPQVFLNLFIDNGFLLIVAIGMTFVILTGGIDLSVGSVVAMTTMIASAMLQGGSYPAWLVLVVCLSVGPALGFLMGCAIHYFQIQPFIVTLA